MGERPLWRSDSGRDDRRAGEDEREPSTIGPTPRHSNHGTENRNGDRKPRDTAEPDQQSGSIKEICGGDEGQARSTSDFTTLGSQGRVRTIIQRAIESIRDAGQELWLLSRHGKRRTLAYYLADERRSRRAGELDVQIPPNQ